MQHAPHPSLSAVAELVPTLDCRTLDRTRNPHWQPRRRDGALHSEVFACGREASGAAAALALALDHVRAHAGGALAETEDRRAVLWVQDEAAIRLGGRPYRPGLPEPLRHRLVHVAVKKVEDALFALEEAVRCRDLAAVIGEVAGNPKALDFTASRRLSLAAERHGVPLWLVRLDAARDLSSARMRWDVAAAPSPHPRWNAQAPGLPSWHAELFRARRHRPASWILRDDTTALVAERIASPQSLPTTPDPVDLAGAARA